MAIHEQVIAEAGFAFSRAQLEFDTVDKRVRGVETWQSGWPSPTRPFLRALTRASRIKEAGPLSRGREVVGLALADARREHEMLVTVDGLWLDTYNNPIGSFLEHLSGSLGGSSLEIVHIAMVLGWYTADGGVVKASNELFHRFRGLMAGRWMAEKDVCNTLESFRPTLLSRNKWEGVRSQDYGDNLNVLFDRLILPQG